MGAIAAGLAGCGRADARALPPPPPPIPPRPPPPLPWRCDSAELYGDGLCQVGDAGGRERGLRALLRAQGAPAALRRCWACAWRDLGLPVGVPELRGAPNGFLPPREVSLGQLGTSPGASPPRMYHLGPGGCNNQSKELPLALDSYCWPPPKKRRMGDGAGSGLAGLATNFAHRMA